MAENGRKQVFDNTYLHNLLFHTQICSMGKWVLFNYPMVSPKVPTTLLTPYSYGRSHLEFPKLGEAVSLAPIVMKIQKVVQKMRDP